MIYVDSEILFDNRFLLFRNLAEIMFFPQAAKNLKPR